MITDQYYAEVVIRFDAESKTKQPYLLKKRVLCYQDNASSYSSDVTTTKFVELRYKLLSHRPYLPDLTLSDFVFFPNLKKCSVGRNLGQMKR